MTDSRSGLSNSISVRAKIATTVVGRNAPASSRARVVRRANNSTAARGVAALEGGLFMILANVRGRLRARDFRLVAVALARGDGAGRARYERLLMEEGPDRLLDEPGLFEALLALRTLAVPSPALFTYVAVRHALLAAGVADRELAEYLAALLLEFGDHDRHIRLGRTDDATYRYLVDMATDLAGLDDDCERGFLLRVHLGNYSLWLAGLFPDYIAAHFGVAGIYRAAAERFPTLRVAFNRLSDRVFFPNVSTPDKILRNL